MRRTGPPESSRGCCRAGAREDGGERAGEGYRTRGEAQQLKREFSVTIVDPIGHGRELMSVKWPGTFHPVTLEGRYKEVPSSVAVSFYAPAEAKRSGTTEAELKAAIERFDFIVR
ncbi:hypothetical protein JQX13_25655 [Archangium violaceum]|uniref:hypothetical protein n=1 Tax=Archangium violaceum TaxID=83451 RepID=UPI00193C1904|nr:hypothetical protein [Archangium violaceum]QRK13111.1 hypothetical protein JQX13_25655 [Archangium violaceum]